MKIIDANSSATLVLGRCGENLARQVVFDVKDFESIYGVGTVEVLYQRPNDAQPYPLAVQRDGTRITWNVTYTDTAIPSEFGKCELRYYSGETLVKSKIWQTWVENALSTPSETTPPEPEQGWVDQVLDAKQTAEKAAVDAKADADRAAVLAAEVAQNASQVAQNVSYTNEAKEAAVLSASEAAQSAQEAAGSASVASTSETNAKASEVSAKEAQKAATESANAAANSAELASKDASAAQQSATSAAESAAVYDTVVADVNQLKQDLFDLEANTKQYLCEMQPYDRQLFDVGTMIPAEALKIGIKTSNLEIVSNTGYRCYPIKIDGKVGETYSLNVINDEITFNSLILVASNIIPSVGSFALQTGANSPSNKRCMITLSQNAEYLLVFVAVNGTPSYPDDPYTTVCNNAVNYLVVRKGSYDTTYYDYEEYISYKVVPYQLESIDNGKVLGIGEDGKVKPISIENANGGLSYCPTRTILLGDNLLNGNTSVTLGNGWSGNINDGFTHSSGSTEPLTFNIGTIQNDKYLIDFIGSSSGNGYVGVQMGNEPVVDVYNGTTHMYVGFISNSGIVKIVPTNQSLSITLTDIKIRKVVSDGTPFSYDCKNVNHGQDGDDITGFWNVAIGSDSTLAKNQNSSRNIAIGNESLRELKTGTRNVAIGTFSIPFVQEGERNVAIGADTIYDTDGVKSRKATDNVAIGKATLKSGTNIADNIAIGSGAMSGNTETASRNVCIGRRSGAYASNNNTHIGYQAGYYTKGNGNTSVGYQAGRDNYNTGDNNTCVGYQAGTLDPASSPSNVKNISDAIAIGSNAKAKKSGQMVLGSESVTEVVFCGNKKINFNVDGTVTWESI